MRRIVISSAALLGLLVAAAPAPAAFPGSNGRIAFQTANGLGTMNAGGGERRTLIGGSAVFATPTWSANGQRVAFASNSAGPDFDIYTTSATGGLAAPLTADASEDGSPAWSPDGGRIVFESDRESANSQIYAMRSDGGNVVRLTSNILQDRAPAWSPNGTRIAFSRGPDGNGDIWTMNADGGSATPLTGDPADETNPDWSPDGARIVFQRGDTIVVMAADGGGQTPLPLPSGAARPAWSPDGARILFDSGQQVYAANPDGSGMAQLTSAGTSALIAQAATWQPVPVQAPPPTSGAPRTPLLRRAVKASLKANRAKGYVVFTALAVKPVRRGDVLRLTCKGGGCPLKRATIRVKKKRRGLSLLSRLDGAKLRKGAVVQLRVTRKGTVGRVTTWKIRVPKATKVTHRCLAPGATKPTRCPAG